MELIGWVRFQHGFGTIWTAQLTMMCSLYLISNFNGARALHGMERATFAVEVKCRLMRGEKQSRNFNLIFNI